MTDIRADAKSAGPEDLNPADIESAQFGTSFRGYAESEVRPFLARVARALGGARERIAQLESELAAAPMPGVATESEEDDLLAALGEETAAVLRSAREAAADLRAKAEQTAARLVSEAQDEAERARTHAQEESDEMLAEAASVLERRTNEADEHAAAELESANEQAREIREEAEQFAQEQTRLAAEKVDSEVAAAQAEGVRIVDEARVERQRVLDDLAARRALLAAQVEELRSGRDRLIDAYGVVKRTFLDATAALQKVEEVAARGGLVVTVEGAQDPALIDDAELAAADVDAVGATDLEPPAFVTDEPMLTEPEPSEDAEPAAEADADKPHGSGEPDAPEPEEPEINASDHPTLEEVDSLFARLRASRIEEEVVSDSSADTEVAADATGDPEAESEAIAGEAEVAVQAMLIERRDDRLSGAASTMTRGVKRAAQDDQNELLDAVRRNKKGIPEPDTVMEPTADHAGRWAEALREQIDEAYGAGSEIAGGSAVPAPDDVAVEVAAGLVGGLRERLAASIAEARADDNDQAELLERLGMRYRDWKANDLEPAVRACLLAASARGAFDASPAGATLRWLVPASGCSADCLDNALEPTLRGETFPTGHVHPPAYSGCRCIAVPSEVLDKA